MASKTNIQTDNKLENLKPRQKEIIDTLLRFRYLTRLQIQTILKHKAKENIRTWLNNLAEKDYVFKIYEKEFAGKPSVFCLEKKSIAYLHELDVDEHIIRWVYDEKTRSQTFRNHNIFVATVYISLMELVSKTQATLKFFSKSDLYTIEYLILPHPDCYFTIKETSGKTKRYFLDVFDDKTFIYKRVYQYLNYYKKNYWQNKTKKRFPEIIFVCPDMRTEKSLIRFIQKKISVDSPNFYLTTKEAIEKRGISSEVLQKVTT